MHERARSHPTTASPTVCYAFEQWLTLIVSNLEGQIENKPLALELKNSTIKCL